MLAFFPLYFSASLGVALAPVVIGCALEAISVTGSCAQCLAESLNYWGLPLGQRALVDFGPRFGPCCLSESPPESFSEAGRWGLLRILVVAAELPDIAAQAAGGEATALHHGRPRAGSHEMGDLGGA